MLKDKVRDLYLNRNYNCAEAILRAANEEYALDISDNDLRLIGGFGGGVQSGAFCGAVLSAVSVISLKLIATKAHETDDLNPAVNMLISSFIRQFGSTLCSGLKPVYSVPEQRCIRIVEGACDALEKVLAVYDEL